MPLLQSPKGLSPTGSAGLLVGPLLPLVAAAHYAALRWPGLLSFSNRPAPGLERLGWLWLSAGLVFWAATLLRFLPRWRRGELITSGPFALCRHPLYALVPYFILPAVALITENRGYLLVALVSIPLALAAGAREEAQLQRLFGEAWVAYAARTNRLLPLPAASHTWRLLGRLAWGMAAALVLYAALLRPWVVSSSQRATVPVTYSVLWE